MGEARQSAPLWPDFTLCAGPVEASPRVLRAMAQPILYHYDPTFHDIFRHVQEKMKQVILTKNDLIIMQGEAVLGLESAAYSCINPGDKCLNLVSGVFGKGYEWYIQLYHGEPVELRVDYDDAIDPEDVRRVLKANPDIKFLSVVHSETPSGTLNPVREICSIAREYGVISIVDAVSAAGGTELRVDDWGIDICVAGPQKCLSSTPGLSVISVSDRAWEAIKRKNAPRFSFLSMIDWKETWLEKGSFPYTPSITSMYAFNESLNELLEEGVENAWKRHEQVARACRAGVKAMGLSLWPRREEICAPCTTAIRAPEGINQNDLRMHMRNRYGVFISGGHGEMKDLVLRIGHMGYSAKMPYIMVALSALGKSLRDFGVAVDVGAGIEAALAEF